MNKLVKSIVNKLPDKLFIDIKFFYHFHRFPNLLNPKTFNEKLQWLKLFDRNPVYCSMVDKYEAKLFIAEKIGEKYIVPTYGIWNSFDEIDFSSLPNKFVLKTTHDCGGVYVCNEYSSFDRIKAKAFLDQHLRYDYFSEGREWPYKNVKPRIIAEEYLCDDIGTDLRDYKFFCFNGIVRCFKVDYNRFSKHGANYYTSDGELMTLGESCCPPDHSVNVKLPAQSIISEMIGISEALSSSFKFLRVDFYYINQKIYIGELTLYPNSGFGPFTDTEWDIVLGNWLSIGD